MSIYSINGKIVSIEFDDDKIQILEKGKIKEFTWEQVSSINSILTFIPPIYKLKIKGDLNSYIFSSGVNNYSFPFNTWDFSEMGEYIRNKKQEEELILLS